jgi:hypothetical protein
MMQHTLLVYVDYVSILLLLAVTNKLFMQLMDPYTYGSLILDTYIKVLQGLNPKENRNMHLYKSSIVTLWLEQIVGKIIWYNRQREFLLQRDYSNNDVCLHVVINKIPYWIIHDLWTCRWLYHQIIYMKGACNHLMADIWIKPNTNQVYNLSISPLEYIFISLHVSIKYGSKYG